MKIYFFCQEKEFQFFKRVEKSKISKTQNIDIIRFFWSIFMHRQENSILTIGHTE